jgi:hypothetical protein
VTNHRGFTSLAATGKGNILAADTVDCMLRRMPIPGPQENAERSSPDDPQCDAFRLIRIALWRERKHTEKLLNGLLDAVKAAIGLVEERTLAKLEDIDTSVSLIAGELARRNSNPPANGTGS